MIYARFDYATPWLRSRNQQATKELTGSSIQWEAKMQLSVCAKRNIIDAKHHIVCGLPQLHLREAQPRSFVPQAAMMLTFGQMMLRVPRK